MRTIDLFAGCGGLSLGFQNAGFEIIAAFDNWKPAVEIYRKNFVHPIYELDLADASNIESLRQLNPEVIIGGPPCQDFSSAGKRDETLGRADLTLSFAQIVASIKPKWFVMENVDRIQKSRVLRELKNLLKEVGYGLTETVLNASRCGVPQDRRRFFLVGELNGLNDTLLPYYKKNMTKRPITLHDYFGNSLGTEFYYRHPRSYARRAVFSIYEPSPTIRGVNRPVPKTYKAHPNDASSDIASLRPLTTKERSYIQTFPQDFIFEGAKTDLEQMIGNAVPVKLADFVGNCLLEYISKQHEQVTRENEVLQLPLL